jgi:CRP/FNR family transcriptional activator FtrB
MGRLTEIQLPLLATVGRSARDALLAQSTVLDVPAGQEVLTEGKTPSHLLFPLDEQVELYARSGRKQATIILSPAQHPFILAAVVKNAPSLMSARTIAKTRILFMPAGRFREVLHRDPGLALATAEELSRAFRTMVRQVRWQKLRTAKMRLAAYLLLQCRSEKKSATIRLGITKRMLASLLGLEPESLSRSFASLAAHGVSVSGDQIEIRDIGKLRAISTYDVLFDAPE